LKSSGNELRSAAAFQLLCFLSEKSNQMKLLIVMYSCQMPA